MWADGEWSGGEDDGMGFEVWGVDLYKREKERGCLDLRKAVCGE